MDSKKKKVQRKYTLCHLYKNSKPYKINSRANTTQNNPCKEKGHMELAQWYSVSYAAARYTNTSIFKVLCLIYKSADFWDMKRFIFRDWNYKDVKYERYMYTEQ